MPKVEIRFTCEEKRLDYVLYVLMMVAFPAHAKANKITEDGKLIYQIEEVVNPPPTEEDIQTLFNKLTEKTNL